MLTSGARGDRDRNVEAQALVHAELVLTIGPVVPKLSATSSRYPWCQYLRIELEARDGRVRVQRGSAALAAGASARLAVPVRVAAGAAPDLAVIVVREENRGGRVRRREREPPGLRLVELDGGEERRVDLVATVVVQGHKGTEGERK